MDESERTETAGGSDRGGEPANDSATNATPSPASGSERARRRAAPPQFGDQDGARRRRRGRRGRGGGSGGNFGGPRPPSTARARSSGHRVHSSTAAAVPSSIDPREESEQARELAATSVVRRSVSAVRWAGAVAPVVPGPAPQGGGQWRQRRGGAAASSDTARRSAASPRVRTRPRRRTSRWVSRSRARTRSSKRSARAATSGASTYRRIATFGPDPVNELILEAQQRRIFVRFTDKMEIARLSPVENHQGVVAIVEGKTGVELDELLLHLDTLSEPALVLVIDSLQDPQNFGVLLRSAEGAGVDGVVIPQHRAVGLTPAVTKTSAGASEHLLIADVPNLRQAIDALKEKGIWVVAADESGDLLYDEVDYRGPTAIVIGGEGEGIRRLVLEGADQAVRLPMEGMVSSLNAAAAGTVMLYEALRQRRRDVPPAQTRTPRPEQPAETQENGGWENEPQQTPEDRAEDERSEQNGSEPAEAPRGGTDETDQIVPPRRPRRHARGACCAKRSKKRAPAKRRTTKKSAEESPKADDEAS